MSESGVIALLILANSSIWGYFIWWMITDYLAR